jgi:hypothetical protein
MIIFINYKKRYRNVDMGRGGGSQEIVYRRKIKKNIDNLSVTLCWRAVLMLWHAFLSPGLGFPPPLFIFLLDGWPLLLFLVRN